jgi:hypothetical protein
MADDITNNVNQGEEEQQRSEEQKSILSDIKNTLIEQSKATGGSLGRDTINVRRHLLEMKNIQKESLANQIALNKTFGIDLQAQKEAAENEEQQSSTDAMQKAENDMEMKDIFLDIRNSLKNQPDSLAKAQQSQAGGIMEKVGSMIGGVGLGVGAAGIGIAAVLASFAYLADTMADLDADKVRQNIVTLMNMGDDFEGGNVEMLKDGGTLTLALSGLGIGLALFAVGGAAAAGVAKFTEGTDWTETIKNNVIALLGIPDAAGGKMDMLADGGTLTLALIGLGLGLTVFALGQGANAVSSGLQAGVALFTKEENWAEGIKQNVLTLLSIPTSHGGALDTLKDGGALTLALIGLGIGLAGFAIGKGVAGVADAVTMFSSGSNFAEDIKAEVLTLLSIADDPRSGLGEGGVAKFIGVMGGLAAGLVAFAIGKAGAGVADAITQFSGGDNFAEDIKSEVATLLTIPEMAGEDGPEKALKVSEILGTLGGALAKFGAGKFIGSLGAAAGAVLDFFSGEKSPVEQALQLADRSDDIDKGINSLNMFKQTLDDFSDMGDIDFNMDTEKMAQDLLGASKTFEMALLGGKTEGGWMPWSEGPMEYTGLVNIDGIDTAVEEINKVKEALGIIPAQTAVEIDAAAVAEQVANAIIQNNSAVTDNSTTTTSSVTVLPTNPNRTQGVVTSGAPGT